MSVKKIVLKDGSVKWEVYCRVTGQDEKRIRRKFDKKIDAQNFLNDFENRKKEIFKTGLQKTTTDIIATTFNVEADYWLKVKSPEFSRGYFRVVNPALNIIRKIYGHYSLEKFSPGLLLEFRNLLRSKGLSVSTQNRYTDIITRIVSFSFSQRRVNFNPCLGYQKQREVTDGINFWNELEIEKFLIFADRKYPKRTNKRWIYIAYLFALETGVRANELWGIKIFDIPTNETKLRVSRQVSGKSSFTATKGRDVRNVPFSSGLKAEIEEWIEWSEMTDTSKTLFVTSSGTPIDHDNFSDRVFQKDIVESGVRWIRFHDLRHTALTMMVKKGVRIDVVQKIAGHKDLKTTMRYVHVIGADIEEVGENLSLSPKVPKKPILKIL